MRCSPRLHRAVDSYKTRVLVCEVYVHCDYALQHAETETAPGFVVTSLGSHTELFLHVGVDVHRLCHLRRCERTSALSSEQTVRRGTCLSP